MKRRYYNSRFRNTVLHSLELSIFFLLATTLVAAENTKDSGSVDNLQTSQSVDNGITRDEIAWSSREILDKVANVYAHCKTYRDSGYCLTEVQESDGSDTATEIAFRTCFRRITKKLFLYRFAYRGNYFDRGFDEASILWHNGQQTLVRDGGSDEFEKAESIGLATAGFTGVSWGTAHTVPVLLIPDEIGGRRLVAMTSLKPPQKEKLEETSCYRIEGLYGDEKRTVWIQAETYLIMRIVDEMKIDEKIHVQTTRYVPTLDRALTDELFNKQVLGEWDDLEKHMK